MCWVINKWTLGVKEQRKENVPIREELSSERNVCLLNNFLQHHHHNIILHIPKIINNVIRILCPANKQIFFCLMKYLKQQETITRWIDRENKTNRQRQRDRDTNIEIQRKGDSSFNYDMQMSKPSIPDRQ